MNDRINREPVICSCGHKFTKAELDDAEICPKCKKPFCYVCGDSVTPVHIFPYGYYGNEYSCGNCRELFC